MTVTFYPTNAAFESASFILSDNAGTQTVIATGTGVSPIASQAITFNPLPNVTYGAGAIALTATASSKLAVSYGVTGPATLSGSTLTITGAGQVTVTANQAGNTSYSAAPGVSRSFTVNQAMLTVTANNASRLYEAGNPAFTYFIAGFVNGDASTVVSESATEAMTATATSIPGSYPITFMTESLAATNYVFSYMSGTLTVLGGASQTITFNQLPNVTYGSGSIVLTATASSGLPVSYAVTGPATLEGSTLTLTGAGLVTVTASQAANADYAAATTVVRSFTVLAASTGNFTITPTPPAEIDRGAIAVFMLEIKPTNGFKGNVMLSCSGGPEGTKYFDLPKTVRVNGTVFAISGIQFPATAKPGTYTITFTGISGSMINTATAKATVK